MWVKFVNAFTKITGWPVQFLCFRTKVYYEDPAIQRRKLSGPAIIVSNHTSVFDYAVYLFVFLFRTLRFQMAEVLFEKKPLGLLLKGLGGIRVNRYSHDLGFVTKSEEILRGGGVVGIFPEGRLPKPEEARPLPFSPSVAYLALSTKAPIIPVYTNGSYFNRKRARVLIGCPMHASQFLDPDMTEKENLAYVTERIRDRIIELGKKLDEKVK